MPGESYRRRLRPLLLYLCYIFRALMNSLCVNFLRFYFFKPVAVLMQLADMCCYLDTHEVSIIPFT